MEIKKTSLSKSFGIYAIKICMVPVLILLATLVLFTLAVNMEWLRLANYEEMRISQAVQTIEQADRITAGIIPETVEYVLLEKDGNEILDRGNMSEKHIAQMRNYLDEGVSPTGLDNPTFKIIDGKNATCVIRYSISVKFSNPVLRMLIPYPEITGLIICIIIFFVWIFLLNRRTAAHMKNELNKLLKATENITQQNLEFDIEVNNITELQIIADSLERMRDALKLSLYTQIKSEQAKSQQISALAHDIKIPITVIRGNTELLSFTELTDKQKEFTDDILSSVLQVENYTHSLVEVSKHNLSNTMTKTKLPVSTLLSEIESSFRAYIKTQKIEFSLENELPSTLTLSVDSDLIHRALLNILCNAVDHNNSVGTIVLNAFSSHAKELILEVQDDGAGFSSEALQHASELFYTRNDARSSDGHYGIGLSFAEQAARLHGGFLTIQNNRTGGQVQFIIPYE